MSETLTASRPPGPSMASFALMTGASARDPFGLLPRIAAKYGDVVDLPVPMTTVTLVSHPDHVEHVFTRKHATYAKPAAAHALTAGEPPALPLLEGEEWKRVRRAFNPFFNETSLAAVSQAMVEATNDQSERWHVVADTGEYIDLEHALGTVVMSTLLRSMFRHDVDDDTLDRWVTSTTAYGDYVVKLAAQSFLPQVLPRYGRRAGEIHKALLLGELDTMIASRISEGPGGSGDLLDVLLGMEFEGTHEEQYARMRSELAGLVFAGFDTTAEALAWTFAFLGQTPSALERAYAEVDALDGVNLTYDHLEQLPFLRACFDEAQRLQAAPLNVRTAVDDDEIGGFRIPAGSHIVISPFGLQRDPRFWTNPEDFDPDRWGRDEITKGAFVPFSTGPRKCMGMRMAYIDGVLTLAAILQRYRFQIRDGWTPRHVLHVSIGLAGGLPVRLSSR